MEVCVLQNDQAVCRIVTTAEPSTAPKTAGATHKPWPPAAAITPCYEQVVIQLDFDGGIACQVALDLSGEEYECMCEK